MSEVDPFDLSWFEPGPVQEEFINFWPPESVFAGGVGSGKTLSGCVKGLLAACMWPGSVGLVGRQSYPALRDTTRKTMLDGDGGKPPVIPEEMILRRSNVENTVTLNNKSMIYFRSLEDHNIAKLLSLNLGWVYIDELTESTERLWQTLIGRMRHPLGPNCMWATTNPAGHDWVWKRWHVDGGEVQKHPGRVLYIQPTEANRLHLPKGYIEKLREAPPEWQKRWVDANFDTAAGVIWDMWDRRVHVYDSELVGPLPNSWKRFRSMDHGRATATAVLFWAEDPDGNLIIEDEYFVQGPLASEHARNVALKTEMLWPGITCGPIIAPPDIFRQQSGASATVAQEYTNAGLHVYRANDNVEGGINRVGERLLRADTEVFPDWHPLRGTKGEDGRGAPSLFVSDKCVNGIREIPEYQYIDLSPLEELKRDARGEPRKKNDHFCDAMRYGVMSKARPPRMFNRSSPRQQREKPRGLPAFSAGLRTRDF